MARSQEDRNRAVRQVGRDGPVPIADLTAVVGVTVQTLERWIRHGRNGVYLDAIRKGEVWLSSPQAVARFLAGSARVGGEPRGEPQRPGDPPRTGHRTGKRCGKKSKWREHAQAIRRVEAEGAVPLIDLNKTAGVTVQALERWVRHGRCGVRLDAIRRGEEWFSSAAAVARFLAAVAEAEEEWAARRVEEEQRQREQQERRRKELDAQFAARLAAANAALPTERPPPPRVGPGGAGPAARPS